jgi:calmodulin
VITEKELKAVYVTFGGEEVEGNEEEIAKFMKEVDTDGDGTVDFPEFCELLIGRMQTIDDPALLEQAFKLFDKDAGGTISREELKETINDVMKGTGEAMSESEFEEMIDEFDADGDGIITFDEFAPRDNNIMAGDVVVDALKKDILYLEEFVNKISE